MKLGKGNLYSGALPRISPKNTWACKATINEPAFSFRITDVDVKTVTGPDESQFYSINILKGNPDFKNFLRLGSEGLVLDPSSLYQFKTYGEKVPDVPAAPYFTDLSVKKNLMETNRYPV